MDLFYAIKRAGLRLIDMWGVTAMAVVLVGVVVGVAVLMWLWNILWRGK